MMDERRTAIKVICRDCSGEGWYADRYGPDDNVEQLQCLRCDGKGLIDEAIPESEHIRIVNEEINRIGAEVEARRLPPPHWLPSLKIADNGWDVWGWGQDVGKHYSSFAGAVRSLEEESTHVAPPENNHAAFDLPKHCPKCGGDDIALEHLSEPYVRGGWGPGSSDDPFMSPDCRVMRCPDGEHMHWSCLTCHYQLRPTPRSVQGDAS